MAAVSLFTALLGGMAQAEPATIYAAGSLSAVLPKLIAASGVPDGSIKPVFGPAGALGQRLRGGETADLFASADLAAPKAVAAAKGGRALVVPFARNQMCVLAPDALGLSPDTLLDRLLSPEFRLATSKPGADPGGDYARAVFARADARRPGAAAALTFATALETPASVLQEIAIVPLVVFGILMIVPHPFRWLAVRMHRVVNKADEVGPQTEPAMRAASCSARHWGSSGRLVPGRYSSSILALVATTQNLAWSGLLLLAYAVGAGIPMLAIGYGGRYVTQHVRGLVRYSHRLQQVFGMTVILVAVGLYYQYDTVVTVWLAQFYPTENLGL